MTVQGFYRPARDDQLKTAYPQRQFNCGPCATRVLIRRWSLGSLNPTIAAIRKAAANQSWFSVNDVSEVLRYFGIAHNMFTRATDFEFADLQAALKANNYGVALGLYAMVPDALSGDPRFDGNHFVMLNEYGTAGPLLYDPVADGRRRGIPTSPHTWPWYVLQRYMQNLSNRPDPDVTCVIVKRRVVTRRFDNVTVRANPTESAPVIGNWHTGPLEYGALVRDSAVSSPPYPAWYRVWWPYTAQIGFVKASQVTA